jgi:2-dehydro-3-deoxyphosphogluconate aldolase / (4S)-4-hydroxy-2-oxoglutarate aldolase
MEKELTLRKIKDLGLLAVIRGSSYDQAIKLVEALVAGGICGIEITYSTPQAAEVVQNLNERFSEQICLGMGTLIEPFQAEEARQVGASFLVSPHCDQELARAMTNTGLVVMLGALTPTEVINAWRLGSDVVKIFPGSLVGPDYIKALRGPFPHIPLMPTGGVSEKNIKDWFKAGSFAVGAGSNLCPKELASQGRFEEITIKAREFFNAVMESRLTE